MIGEIGYLGQVSPRVGIGSAALYVCAITSGALVLGFSLGSLGLGVRWVLDLDYTFDAPGLTRALGVVAILGAARDLGLLPMSWMPQPSKQLPRHWMAVFGPYRTSLQWGFYVGIGRKTRAGYALYYFLVLWVLVSGNPVFGGLLLATFGLVHGLFLLVEVAGIAYRKLSPIDGLLGINRSDFLFRYSGLSLLGSGLYLLVYAAARP
jgi:hypothetical protein